MIPVPFTGSNAPTAPSKFAPLFFPLIGLVIGLAMASAFALIGLVLPVQLAAALMLAAGVALTGAIHIDGLADFTDGAFGGRNTEDRLRIMKLPDVGAFGMTAVVLVLLVDWTAVSSLGDSNSWVVLALAGLISRTAPLVVMSMTSYISLQAPGQGLGQSYVGLSRSALLATVFIVVGIAFAIGGWLAVAAAFAGLLMAFVVGAFAKKRLGGANGDVYGASVELSFAVALIGAIAVIDAGEKFEPIWSGLPFF